MTVLRGGRQDRVERNSMVKKNGGICQRGVKEMEWGGNKQPDLGALPLF